MNPPEIWLSRFIQPFALRFKHQLIPILIAVLGLSGWAEASSLTSQEILAVVKARKEAKTAISKYQNLPEYAIWQANPNYIGYAKDESQQKLLLYVLPAHSRGGELLLEKTKLRIAQWQNVKPEDITVHYKTKRVSWGNARVIREAIPKLSRQGVFPPFASALTDNLSQFMFIFNAQQQAGMDKAEKIMGMLGYSDNKIEYDCQDQQGQGR